MNFKDLKLETKTGAKAVQFNDMTLQVRQYLPIAEKTALIEYVVSQALDQTTGRFSPIRIQTFFSLAIAHYYGGIDFEDDVNAAIAYDMLKSSYLLDAIITNIETEEYDNILDLVNETVQDIADYNSSFAGILRMASNDADGLDGQIEEIMSKVRNKEGLELLDQIKNVVGTN